LVDNPFPWLLLVGLMVVVGVLRPFYLLGH
jgi:hypothetical protein